MRFLAVLLISYSPSKYTLKERIFMAISWIPKSTVPATLASVIYTEALAHGAGWEEYVVYGNDI
jgi:hypothetical protein